MDELNLLASNIGAYIDVCAIIIILVCAVVAAARGFTKSFVLDFSTILSILFAIALCTVTATFLEKQFALSTTLSNKLIGTLTNVFGEQLMNTPIGDVNNTDMTGLLSQWLINTIVGVKEAGTLPPETTLNKIICPIFGYYLSCAIAIIILFILFKILFVLIGELIKKAREFILIKAADTIFGLVLGVAKGIIIVQLLVMLINFMPFGFFQNVALQISTAPITNFISKINVLAGILSIINNPTNIIDIIKVV